MIELHQVIHHMLNFYQLQPKISQVFCFKTNRTYCEKKIVLTIEKNICKFEAEILRSLEPFL